MATSSDATTAATSADAHAATTTSAGSAGDSETDPYAYTYADRPGEWYAPYTVLFANTAADLVPEHWVARYEREAAKNWDKFYLRHGSTFFRDRHYLGKEWSELDGAGGASTSAADAAPAAAADDADGDGGELERHIAEADGELVLFEAGCAVGNTLFPLLSKSPPRAQLTTRQRSCASHPVSRVSDSAEYGL